MTSHRPRITWLAPDGREAQGPAFKGEGQGGEGSLIGASALGGARLRWDAKVALRSLRVRLVLGSRTETLNSWVRDLRVPPRGAFQVEHEAGPDALPPWQERLFQVQDADAVLGPSELILELLQPAAVQVSALVLRFPPGAYAILGIEGAAAPYEGTPFSPEPVSDLPSYPAAQPDLPRDGDRLAEQLLSRGEATLEGLWRLALPYRGAALIGAPEGPIAAVNWDGGVIFREPAAEFDRVWFKLELGPGAGAGTSPLSGLSGPARQGLLEGWLPVSVVTQEAGGLRLSQTAFVDLQGRLCVRWEIDSVNGGPATALTMRLVAARSRLRKTDNDGLRAPAHEPVPCQLGEDWARIGARQGSLRVSGAWPTLVPGGRARIDLVLPLSEGAAAAPPDDLDAALLSVRRHFHELLAQGAALDLPDPLLQDLWRALLVHNFLFVRGGQMRYGLFPGVYEDAIFGVEEGWNIVAFALYGHGRAAKEVLARTFFDAAFLAKEGQHHQYRNGLALTYALDVHRLLRDPAWLRGLYPTVQESARWIVKSLRSTQVLGPGGERPPYYGLMPRHTYGGDLKDPTYSLYGSSACWRGLRDAALLAEALGEAADGERFGAAAEQARADMLVCASRIFKHDGAPPFLPFRVDEAGSEPSAHDYHQLFASLILETALFGWEGDWARSITDYLHRTGRQVLGVARFDQWFGRLGVDAEYSRGFQLAHLLRRDFDRFWLGVVGQIGLSCDPCTFVSPETAVVRFTREEHQDRMRTLARNPRRFDSDPCSAGTGVMLQYLRYLLLFEERGEDDLPTGTLWVGAAAPRAWFQPGQSFGGARLPTALGQVSLRCTTTAAQVTYQIESDRPLQVEAFWVDAGGARRSVRARVEGRLTLKLART
jgi:hypothetical protein